MSRSDIIGDRIRVAQDKARKGSTNELLIRIHPALARALSAGPVVGLQHLISDARGKPLRNLTDLIEKAVKLAGLPPRCVAHGLRKAALRRLAEHGSTTKEIARVGPPFAVRDRAIYGEGRSSGLGRFSNCQIAGCRERLPLTQA